ncbi:FtsK/SpoIIIE domain-containing protein [Actinokineospora globicatena]|uniref:FtsK/SpoIIIE domain-containing protein n=1 Tax=Actinokineospora globicatena TaxID=103729 RepID=UPI0027E35928|nr:FtsK/SpoIIIE domain-containing protein [Actinokineospora globicatena]
MRHPGVMALPTVGAGAVIEWGPGTAAVGAGWAAGVSVAAGVAWRRGAPGSFDYYAAPVLRAWRRRWGTYVGVRWRRVMEACELYRTDRRSGVDEFPRVVRVRAYSPSVDTVVVRMVRGQSAKQYEAKLEELADTLRVRRVAVERTKPGYVVLVIERREPFTEVIAAPEMPGDVDAVDLSSVYVGDTEYDTDFRVSITGNHVFVAGATGAGKNSIPASILRALAPLIRDGLVRLWIADPKQLEFSKLEPIAYRYSSLSEAPDDEDLDDDGHEGGEPLTIAALIGQFKATMAAKQARMAADGDRTLRVSPETPLDLLIVDEIGAVLAYAADPREARMVSKDLAVILTQGRATLNRVIGLVQEPTKDTVPVRDLFTLRVCLRVTTAAQVDMVLGENARLRGALADEIPNVPETAGIGYVIQPRSRVPQRVRAAYVTDAELDELLAFVLAGRAALHTDSPEPHLKAVA